MWSNRPGIKFLYSGWINRYALIIDVYRFQANRKKGGQGVGGGYLSKMIEFLMEHYVTLLSLLKIF